MVNREVAMRVFSQVPGNLALDTMPMTLIDLSDAASLATFIEVLVRDLGRRRPAFSTESALPHVERLLLTLLAEAIRGARGLLDDRERTTAAPYYVVRAEDYLRRHYTGKIRMGDVARACGVSLRTLHYGFKRFRDRGPAELLREIRLTQARQGLIEARLTGLRVAEIAASSGFPNASQFTRDYRAHFGESPLGHVTRGVRWNAIVHCHDDYPLASLIPPRAAGAGLLLNFERSPPLTILNSAAAPARRHS